MMRKRNEGMIKSFQNTIPDLPDKVKTKDFNIIENFDIDKWSSSVSGSNFYFNDYAEEEEIHHLDGQTIEEAEHQIATRLYQNNLVSQYHTSFAYMSRRLLIHNKRA